MTMMILYPREAATDASPIPVFPDVGSIIVVPDFSFPEASASSSIFFAIRSFTDPAGLKYSSLARIFALSPKTFSMFDSSRSGV